MKQERLTGLSDGIFAIVMTLLVLTLKVPELPISEVANANLWQALSDIKISFLSFVFSFALLFTYWNAHHFIISVYAKNITFPLVVRNAIFLIAIALVPFSTHFLGIYSQTQIAVFIYGLHIILISAILFEMKRFVIVSHDIESILSYRDIRNGNIRLALPGVFSVLAILLSFVNTNISLSFFAFVVVFNLVPGSTDIVVWLLDGLKKREG
ncbi:MAG TPA: TMEM175 family protein [Candidatus Paceibacterota bacterium]|nr:TMEM175 family protein [Candidatus Paceibacterota bacterium]